MITKNRKQEVLRSSVFIALFLGVMCVVGRPTACLAAPLPNPYQYVDVNGQSHRITTTKLKDEHGMDFKARHEEAVRKYLKVFKRPLPLPWGGELVTSAK